MGRRKRRQRWQALVLVVCMCISMLPQTVVRAEEQEKPKGDVCVCESTCEENALNKDCPVCGKEDAVQTECKKYESDPDEAKKNEPVDDKSEKDESKKEEPEKDDETGEPSKEPDKSDVEQKDGNGEETEIETDEDMEPMMRRAQARQTGKGTAEDPYEIATVADLKAFRDMVNSGTKGVCARLTADIVLNPGTFDENGNYNPASGEAVQSWEPIGTYSNKYDGIFDGNKHTITGLHIKNNSEYQGLFGSVSGGSVINLGIINSYVSGGSYIGGVAGLVIDGGSITNCYYSGSVIGSGNTSIGGIVGSVYTGSVINCYHEGSVRGNQYIGGIVGQIYGDTNIISSCYNTGKVTGNQYVGGVAGQIEACNLTNCYNMGDVVATNTVCAGITGRMRSGNVTTCYNTGNVTGSDYVGSILGLVFEGSVENCYYLNTSANQGIGKGAGSAIALDAVQMTGPNALTHMTGFSSDIWTASNSAITATSNGTKEVEVGTVDVYTVTGELPQLKAFELQGNKQITAEYESMAYYKDLTDSKTYYLIYNKDELKTFANIVNDTLTAEETLFYAKNNSANGRLMADIVLNPGTFDEEGTYIPDGGVQAQPQAWTPIGDINNNTNIRYGGTFDGNAYTISGLYINNNSYWQGLFGYVEETGNVKNLGIENSYISGKGYIGGVAGLVSNGGSITDCYYSGSVAGSNDFIGGIVGGVYKGSVTNCYHEGAVRGNQYVGGIAGYITGDTNTVSGCYNTGEVTGNQRIGGVAGLIEGCNLSNCYNTGAVNGNSNCGGIVGSLRSGTVTSCYNTGMVDGSSGVGGISGYVIVDNGTIENCYYLTNTAEQGIGENNGTGSAEPLTIDQMTGREALTNMTGLDPSIWTASTTSNQTSYNVDADDESIGKYEFTGELPQLNVFAAKGHEKFIKSLNGLPKEEDTTDRKTYYLIYNEDQLKTFANIVNGNLEEDEKLFYTEGTGANGRLKADIVLNPGTFDESGNYTPSAEESPEEWTPICNYKNDAKFYSGTFDGGGHSISGLYINSDSNNQGLFGFIMNGTVKNVSVEKSYVKGNQYVGGVAGDAAKGKIENCSYIGTVSGYTYVGGVAGHAYSSSSVTNCCSNGLVTGSHIYVGGVAGQIQSDSSVQNCYNTGKVSGNMYLGGIAGNISNSTVKNCYNVGTVSGNDLYGGIVGYIQSDSSVQNCYNTGEVSGNREVGGVTGWITGGCTLTNCYYLNTSAEQGIGGGTASAKPLTIDQMTGPDALSNMVGFSPSIWTAGSDNRINYSPDKTDETVGKYEFTGELPQLTVFKDNGHQTLSKSFEGLPQEEDTTEGKTYYLIYNKDQLETFADIVNGELDDDEKLFYTEGTGANGRLKANIVLNPGIFDEEGHYIPDGGEQAQPQAWTPIGDINNNNNIRYGGTFDGNRHTITGLYVKNDSDYQGLFGYVSGGSVKNLGIENSYVSGKNHIGGVAGSVSSGGSITDCYYSGSVVGSYLYIGGIVGYINDGSVTNCYHEGSVHGNSNVGGIAGHILGNNSTVSGCYNTGKVTGNRYVGGVAGEIKGCNLSNCYNTGVVDRNFRCGGIVGGLSDGTVTSCYYLNTSAERGIGYGTGSAEPLTVAQIENELLGLLNGGGSGWNETCGAMGEWEYGKPAVQPVFTWQQPKANVPVYTVTIPETAAIDGEGVVISANAGALKAVQQVTVKIVEDNDFALSAGGDYELNYKVLAGTDKTQVVAGGTVFSCGNTEPSKPAENPLYFEPEGEATYAGEYTGTVTFNVSVETNN